MTLIDVDAAEWHNNNYSIEVIPNIVNLNDGIVSSHSSNHVILVARFNLQKQISDAINIWSVVHKKHPDWILDIYGEGELKDAIRNKLMLLEEYAFTSPLVVYLIAIWIVQCLS